MSDANDWAAPGSAPPPGHPGPAWQPGGQAGQPGAQPGGQAWQPDGPTSQPGGQAWQPDAQASQPGGQASQPGGQASQPGGQASQPGGQAWQPGAQAWHQGGQAGPGWQQAPQPGPQWHPGVPKPGVIPLRPLGVGEILDGAISYIRANPVATLGLAAVAAVAGQAIQILVSVLLLGPLAAASPTDLADGGFVAGVLGSALLGSLVGGLVSFFVSTVVGGLLIVVLSQAVLGRRLTIGEAWRTVRGRIPGLLGIGLLSGLGVAAAFAVCFLPMVLALVTGTSGVLVGLLGGLGALAGIAAAVFLGVLWSLTAPAYVLEGATLGAAYGRSVRLVRGQWWRVFGILLLGLLIAMVISSVLAAPFGFLASSIAAGSIATALSPAALAVSGIGSVLAATIVTPFVAGMTGLVYFDQRIRREALDMVLLREVGGA